VPSSRFILITAKTPDSSPTDYVSSGSGSEHRIVTCAELATDPIQLKSSRACHRHVTALQLAVDHAFTGSYAQRFRPADPPETLTCPCGAPLRTPQHITRECPLFYQTRVNHAIHTYGRTIAYSALYNSHPHKLLSFLRDSRAASRPPDFGPPVEVAPEPD
jgi:hypothetical protein